MVGFNYGYSKNLSHFPKGSIIKFGTLQVNMSTGNHGNGIQIIPNITFQIIENNKATYTLNSQKNTTTIPDYTVQNDSTDVILSISVYGQTYQSYFNTTTSDGAIIINPVSYISMFLSITLPTTSTFVMIAPNGIGINFGTNKNVYIGNECFVANYGSYKLRVDSNGIQQNNVHKIKVLNNTTTYSMSDDEPYDTFISRGDGNATLVFPKNPYDGQTILIFDQNNGGGSNFYINTNGKKFIEWGNGNQLYNADTRHELNSKGQWQYVFIKELDCWQEMRWNV